VSAGTVLWGEAFNSEWSATGGSASLRHERAFGWANGFALGRRGSVSIAYGAQWQRWALLAVSLLIWVIVAWRWRRTRVRRDPAARALTAQRRRERKERHDPLTEVLDEDAFWWERV
jgi:hypothetical protein